MTEASEVPFGLEVSKGLIAKFLMAIIGFIGTILFARILGPVAFGGFYLVWSVVKIVKLPVDGFETASMKRYSETGTDRSAVVGTTLLVVAGVSFVATVGAIFLRARLASYTGLESAAFLFVILLVSVSLFTTFQGLLSGTGRVSLTVWIDLLRSVLTTPLQLAFILLGFSAAGMAYGLTLATLLTIPATLYFLGAVPSWPSRHLLRRIWEFARYSIVSSTFGRIYSRFDVLLLGALLTPSAVGHYEVALKLTIPAVLLSKVASDGLMARVSNLQSKGEAADVDVSNILSFTSILAIPLFFGAAVLSRPLVVTIYGPEYAAASSMLVGLALFRVFSTQAGPLTRTLQGIDRPELNVRVSAVTLALNVVLGVALTLYVGAIGVVVATVIAEALKYVVSASLVRREIPDVELFPITLLEQIAVATAMAVAVVGAHHAIPVQSWIHLLVLVGFGAAVYGGGLLVVSDRLRFALVSILRDAGVEQWLSARLGDR